MGETCCSFYKTRRQTNWLLLSLCHLNGNVFRRCSWLTWFDNNKENNLTSDVRLSTTTIGRYIVMWHHRFTPSVMEVGCLFPCRSFLSHCILYLLTRTSYRVDVDATTETTLLLLMLLWWNTPLHHNTTSTERNIFDCFYSSQVIVRDVLMLFLQLIKSSLPRTRDLYHWICFSLFFHLSSGEGKRVEKMKRELKNRVCSLRFSFSLLSSPFLCVCLWFDGTFSSSSPPRDLPSFHFLSFSFLSFCLTHFISSFFFPFHLCETENWKHFCPDGKDPSSSAITSKLHTIRNIRLGVWDRWESHYRQKRCFGASPSLVITHFVSFPFLCSDLDSFPIVIIIIRDRHFPLSSLRVSQSSIFLMEWWRLNDKRQKIHLLLAIMMMNCCWWWWVDNHNNNGQFCRLPIFSHKMSVCWVFFLTLYCRCERFSLQVLIA